jgi:hypothetical protein
MRRFVEGTDRGQTTLLPECLGDWVEESNAFARSMCSSRRSIWAIWGFNGVQPLATGRPAYHPSTLLKLYIYARLSRYNAVS